MEPSQIQWLKKPDHHGCCFFFSEADVLLLVWDNIANVVLQDINVCISPVSDILWNTKYYFTRYTANTQLTRFEKSINKLTGTQKPKFWKTVKKHWTLLKTAFEKVDIRCSDITWFLRICEILVSFCAVFAITFHAAFILWSRSDVSKQSKRMEISFPPHVTIFQLAQAHLWQWAPYCNTTKY